MSADQILPLVAGLIVIAAAAVMVAFATARSTRRDGATPGQDPSPTGPRGRDERMADPATAPATGTIRIGGSLISPTSTRQVARVVAFLFLASAAFVVALTGAWPDTQAAVFTLLATGMLLVVLFFDMIPPTALGRWRHPAEGIGAIVYLGLLMALTGGAGSPFLVGFFLVVAGTALSTEGRAPLAIAVAGSATVALVAIVDALDAPLDASSLAWVGINAVALILLADIATAAARAQRHARDEAIRASRFDALTGLYNRSFFFTTMEQEIRRSDRMGRGFTMLMLDLDDLKPVNDTFGHQWGDRLLKAIADTIRATVRFTDAAARYGGDEFVVLLPETDAAGGYVVGEKLRRDIAALTLHAADRNVRSSVSVGLVTYPDDGTTIEQLVAAADLAMYESKRRGKNRIVGYQTRTERVATAIDADSAELVQLTPPGDVRTGGDPAPWGALAPDAGTEPEARRRHDRSTIPVEPEGATPAPWSTERAYAPESRPAPERAQEPESGSRPEPEPTPEHRSGPGPRSTTGTGRTPPKPRPSPEDIDAALPPWLTRTDDHPPPPRRSRRSSGVLRPPDPPQQRPAADLRSSGRGSSRSDEIMSGGERPWIALPIEPYDPPERPRG